VTGPLGAVIFGPTLLLKSDSSFLPPAASALLVIFNRNHNYICDMLLKINERKRWTDPVPTDPKQLALQDEEIFQTARLVKYVLDLYYTYKIDECPLSIAAVIL
jgi:Animal haem peroxidase.